MGNVYLSACKVGNTDKTNTNNMEQLAYILAAYGFADVLKAQGRYDGHSEQSFLVRNVVASDLSDLCAIASMFRQECILWEDEKNDGYLVDCTGSIATWHHIGKKHISNTTPDVARDYTFIPGIGYITFK